jgi:hypothetical protein
MFAPSLAKIIQLDPSWNGIHEDSMAMWETCLFCQVSTEDYKLWQFRVSADWEVLVIQFCNFTSIITYFVPSYLRHCCQRSKLIAHIT